MFESDVQEEWSRLVSFVLLLLCVEGDVFLLDFSELLHSAAPKTKLQR